MLIDKERQAKQVRASVEGSGVAIHNFRRSLSGPMMVLVALLLTMMLSLSGLPGARWSIYVLPFVATLVWLSLGPHKFHAPREVWPFILLVIVSLFTLYAASVDGWKRFYFLFEYGFVFILFSFYKVKIDIRKLVAFFVFLFILTSIRSMGGVQNISELEVSILESYSSLESTLAFCFGLIGLHLIIKRRYFWAAVCIGFSILGLKRIVLVAIAITLIVNFLPSAGRKFVTNPIVLTVLLVFAVVVTIVFAQGGFDQLVIDYAGKHPNAFAMGRQTLWADALRIANYNWQDYFIFGMGHSGITDAMANYYNMPRIRLHNDALTILLDHGWIVTSVFLFLLVNLKLEAQRLMAFFIGIIFLTDNVIIYQHVMLLYLILQQQVESYRSEERAELTSRNQWRAT